MDEKVRVRYAHIPMGYLHIGDLRIAVLNWLFARKYKGSFVLRVEDRDTEKSDNKYIDSLIEDLRWLGLEWNEGPDIGGENGPYRQSLRQKIYREYLDKLKEKQMVYPCFCSEEILESCSKEALSRGELPKYDNRCRELTEKEIRRFTNQGIAPAWRFKVPDKKITVKDQVRGDIVYDAGLFSDFIVVGTDGLPEINFAVCIDDIAMDITHIIRGEDYLSKTARQILVCEALGTKIPKFAHIMLVLGADGTRLNKNHGAISISEYRKFGYLPEALINYMALLGWSAGGERELFSVEELILSFSLQGLTKESCFFNQEKLDEINNYHIQQADLSRLTNLILPYLKREKLIEGPVPEKVFESLKEKIAAIRNDMKNLSQAPELYKSHFQK